MKKDTDANEIPCLQLSSLARENKILMEELQKTRKNGAEYKQDNKDDDEKESSCVVDDPATGMSAAVSAAEHLGETPTSAAANNQVGTHFLQVLYVDFLNLRWNCMCNAVSYTHEWLVVPIRALSLCTYLKAIARKT